MTLNERIIETIKRLMLATGRAEGREGPLPMAEVGRRCDPPTTSQQIEKLLKGQTQFRPEWLDRVSAAFGITPWELVRGELEPPFEISAPVADEIAQGVCRFLRIELAKAETLALLLQELCAALVDEPEARSDPKQARMLFVGLTRRFGGQ